MDFLAHMPLLSVFALAILLVVGGYYMRAYYRARTRYARMEERLQALAEIVEEHKIISGRLEEAQELRTRAETRLAEAQKQIDELKELHRQALADKESAQRAGNEAQKQLELIEQKIAQKEEYWKDLERQRENAIKDAKAAIIKAGGELSNKLLADHKREIEAAKKTSEEITKKTTDNLTKDFKSITEAVATLHSQVQENRSRMDTVWRSLSSPAGAGQLAEIGLENSLKNLGLEPGRDFIMQYAISGGGEVGLRPDAVIFLPQDMLMVIDSKASKALLEIAAAEEGSEQEQQAALADLAKSMNKHLKALQSKDYKTAIHEAYRATGRSSKIGNMHMVMYLPSEGAVDNIKRADPSFVSKVEKAGIILASPASLSGLLSLASINIGMEKQAQNQTLIVEKTRELMDSMIVMFEHASSLGRNLKTTANFYDKFAGSVNGRVLPKLRALTQLGVKTSGSRELPGRIISYDIRLADEVITVEAEQEEENNGESAAMINQGRQLENRNREKEKQPA